MCLPRRILHGKGPIPLVKPAELASFGLPGRGGRGIVA